MKKSCLPQLFILAASLLLLAGVSVLPAASTWTENSFEDFNDGTFLDARSNLYVSARGRIQMINRWDLNGDGYLDIVMPSGHGHTEKENTYIYLNNGEDIDGRSRIDLPGNGSSGGLVADLNKDGWNDLAIVNHADSHAGDVNAWIYYGAPEGLTVENRVGLPAFRGSSIAAGDFNGDGWRDLAFACRWYDVNDSEQKEVSLVYWNSPGGFDAENKTPLNLDGAQVRDVVSADLDGDGTDDLIALAEGKMNLYYSTRGALENQNNRIVLEVSGSAAAVGNVNGDKFKDIALCFSKGVKVLFGGEDGYTLDRSVVIPSAKPVDLALADFDRDGLDDIAVAIYESPGGATWTQSCIFYSDGNDFSTREPLALDTLGASAVSAGDLNADGFPELVVSNMNVTNERTLLSYVFWNEKGSFRNGDHSQLTTQGSMANAIGDLNHDGMPDVVFFNDEGGFRDGPTHTHIYWGDGTRNYTMERRTTFPSHHVFGQGHADLDDDGFVDLVLAQSHFNSGIKHEQMGLILYWGGQSGFKGPSNLTMGIAYGGMRIADINKDGWLDMVAGGVSVDLTDPNQHGFPIFWGSSKGFLHNRRTVIPFEGQRMRAPLLMDLNRDGWLDIAGQVEDGFVKIWWGAADGYDPERFQEIDLERGDHLMYIKGADFNKDGWLDLLMPQRGPPDGMERSSFIYYGSPDGYSNGNRTEINSYVPYQNSIVDFDRDGWLDIFLTSYGGEVNGNRPSLIYWGGKDGFNVRPRTELPTYGSSGSETLDFDGDGYIDILIADHRRAGSTIEPVPHRHTTNSMLYWGGPNGFSPDNRWEVEAAGPSGLNLRDAGNSYDRGLYEDYISSPYQIPNSEKPASMEWQADTPLGTTVSFQVRSAMSEEALDSAAWQGPNGPDSWFIKNNSRIKKAGGNWIQYRARLTTPNGGATPYLNSVTISFK